MKFLFLISLISLLSVSCFRQSKQETAATEPLSIPVLDLNKTYPMPDDTFTSSLAYIPLETSEDILVDKYYRLIYYSNSRIIIVNAAKGDIFVFDGKGKIVSHFNRTGKGAEEYWSLSMQPYGSVVAYDEEEKNIFVMERTGICRIYSENGTYLRAFRFPRRKQYREAYSFDSESLLVFDANIETDSAYVLISKKDGTVLSCLDIPLSNRMANFRLVNTPQEASLTTGLPRQQLLKDGDNFILTAISSDTIYRFTRGERPVPVLAITPSIKESDPPLDFQPLKVTDKYVFGYKYIFDITNDQPKLTYYLFDIEKRQAFQVKDPDINYIGDLKIKNFTNLPTGLYVITAFPDQIFEKIEKGNLDDAIKKVAAQLTENDNPVIQVIKFK